MANKSSHILVADDDPIYRGVAQETLELAGHKVTIASDGGEAIARLAETSFDAAIIDLTMPVADGITVIETMRKGGVNSTIPVIVITGHDDAQAVERAYLAGATSFLTKPLNWILFTPHIEFVLRSGQTERELRETSATAAFLSDLKSQVMKAIAHEFQAPIKTIFGFSELMQKEVYGPMAPPQYKDMMSDISKSANSLNAALLKVLDFGRTLTQNLEVKSEAIAVLDAVRNAVGDMDPLAQRRNIRVNTEFDIGADAQIFADRALLNQAIRGIIENAIRMSNNGTEIDILAELDADGGLVISVGDSGPAHPQDFLREVNGQTKAAPAMSGHQQSSGVSIKIAKVLAEAHNGQLTIKSDTMSGNTVRFSIPKSGKAPTVKPAVLAPQNEALNRLAQISAELSQDRRLGDRRATNAGPLRPAQLHSNRSGEKR
jgi:signal transduction histidine kinase